ADVPLGRASDGCGGGAARCHHDRSVLREPAGIPRHEPRARLRDLRGARVEQVYGRLGVGSERERSLPGVAASEPQVSVLRVSALHGAARPLQAHSALATIPSPSTASILRLDASHLSGRNLLIPGTDDLVFSATRAGIAPDGTATEVLAVRSAHWKLIFTPGLARYELYDLSDDPTESRNRFGEVPEGANLAWAVADW